MAFYLKSGRDNSILNKVKFMIGGSSGYLQFIILFGILFSILQISDLAITYYALQNPHVKEINPFYDEEWFIPFKLTAVFLIMAVMYRIPSSSRRLAKKAMLGIIYMYMFINLNNLYHLLYS